MSEKPEMNRSAEEVFEALRFVAENGLSGLLIGDNEMARAIVAYYDLREALASLCKNLKHVPYRDAAGLRADATPIFEHAWQALQATGRMK